MLWGYEGDARSLDYNSCIYIYIYMLICIYGYLDIGVSIQTLTPIMVNQAENHAGLLQIPNSKP